MFSKEFGRELGRMMKSQRTPEQQSSEEVRITDQAMRAAQEARGDMFAALMALKNILEVLEEDGRVKKRDYYYEREEGKRILKKHGEWPYE